MAESETNSGAEDLQDESTANDAVDQAVESISQEQADASSEQPVTIESLQEQLADAENRVLRGQAELENARKRARRDLEEQRKYANLPLVSDVLPAIDNLGRAVEAAEQNENATGLLEGVKMVAMQIDSVLAKYNCRRVPAVGSDFDPNIHEAIAQEPSEEHPAGKVTRELLVGYQLNDRVIRPSQVMVSTGPLEAESNEDSTDERQS
jgi:molecular chaperone GrpE